MKDTHSTPVLFLWHSAISAAHVTAQESTKQEQTGPRLSLLCCLLSLLFNHQNTPPQTLEDPPDIKNKFYFSVSLDHCYLSPDDNKKTMSSSDSGDTNTGSVWRQQEV